MMIPPPPPGKTDAGKSQVQVIIWGGLGRIKEVREAQFLSRKRFSKLCVGEGNARRVITFQKFQELYIVFPPE